MSTPLAELVPGQKYIVYPRVSSDPNKKYLEGTFVETTTTPPYGFVRFSDATKYSQIDESSHHYETYDLYIITNNLHFTFVRAPATGGRRKKSRKSRRRASRRRATRRA